MERKGWSPSPLRSNCRRKDEDDSFPFARVAVPTLHVRVCYLPLTGGGGLDDDDAGDGGAYPTPPLLPPRARRRLQWCLGAV